MRALSVVHLRLRLRRSRCLSTTAKNTRKFFEAAGVMYFPGQRRFRRRHRMGRQFFGRDRRAGFGVEEVAAGVGIGAAMAYVAGQSNNDNRRAQYPRRPNQMATAMPPGTRMMSVTCPPGVGPGHPMQVNVDGRLMTVTVPQGVYSGMQFQFAVPNTASPQQPHAQMQNRGLTPQLQPNQTGETSLQVTCPAGVTPGQKLVVQTGNGPLTTTVPQGVRPGTVFKVVIPSSGATASFSGTTMQQQSSSMIQSLNNSYTGATAQRVRVLPESQWQKDSAHATCQQCFTSFTLLNRKHHCRYCGRVLCDNCSSYKIKKLRACKMCFDTVYPNRQSYAGQPPGVVSRNPNMQAMRPQQYQAPMPMQRAPVVGTNMPTVPQQGNVLQASVLPQQPRNAYMHASANLDTNMSLNTPNTMHAPVVQASAPLLSNDATAKPPAQQQMSAPQESNSINETLIKNATSIRRQSFEDTLSNQTKGSSKVNSSDSNNSIQSVENVNMTMGDNYDEKLAAEKELEAENRATVARTSGDEFQSNLLVAATAVPLNQETNQDDGMVVVHATPLEGAPGMHTPVYSGATSAINNNASSMIRSGPVNNYK